MALFICVIGVKIDKKTDKQIGCGKKKNVPILKFVCYLFLGTDYADFTEKR